MAEINSNPEGVHLPRRFPARVESGLLRSAPSRPPRKATCDCQENCITRTPRLSKEFEAFELSFEHVGTLERQNDADFLRS